MCPANRQFLVDGGTHSNAEEHDDCDISLQFSAMFVFEVCAAIEAETSTTGTSNTSTLGLLFAGEEHADSGRSTI